MGCFFAKDTIFLPPPMVARKVLGLNARRGLTAAGRFINLKYSP